MSDDITVVEDTSPSDYKVENFNKSGGDSVNGGTDASAKEPEQKSEDNDNKRNEIYSLSYDQVNDNADELIELRGEGRYFGVTDPTSGRTINAQQSLGPLCANCHRRGHIRAKCKTVVCHKCGVVGDHYETQCPTTMVCSRCGLKGHMAANCKNKNRKRQYCKNCDTFAHGDDNCPSIWRSYLTTSSEPEGGDKAAQKLPLIYCYNCGSKKHYGDECQEQRTSRIPNTSGSAFSGSNLPRHLRALYFELLSGGGSKRSHNKSNNTGPAKGKYGAYHNKQKGSYGNPNGFRSSNENGSSRNFFYNGNGPSRSSGYGGAQYGNNGEASSNMSSNAYRPSRSGFISKSKQNKNSKESKRSGYTNRPHNSYQNTGYQQPTRSGLIENQSSKSKKSKLRNIKHLY
ncbi:Piso0_005391 [Millerozyma farinosa CBS 7064]|uniref:Piso0_005391 protein n=1 Tax=Pichia sorbitophila (strain ATCC MYA-4447 / BCRC 22081 / CBS 7064 / NBRC 10061 / NRRL Y-12695) TaxID=559304 RepID=G8Y4Z5_PICSO|nr:Piso0_005391 [Millerozyma farinosa CBS 7064]